MKEFAKKTGLLAFTLILLTSCGVNPEGKDKKSAKEFSNILGLQRERKFNLQKERD